MASNEERVAIISLDGLSATQFEVLQSRMPSMQGALKDGTISELDAAPFSDTQPIWAEILTGQPWFRNGCCGYAVPHRSLNEMKVFTELDLLSNTCLLPAVKGDQRNVLINVPLLLPKPEERVWIADSSSPCMSTVSPESLLEQALFRSHRPRPLVSMGAAMADDFAIEKFVDTEISRLNCVLACLKTTNTRMLIYRVNIFDHLAHLLGPSFLSETELKISSRINNLLLKLDQGIAAIISTVDKYLFVSGFSHRPCKEMFSLNDLFQNAGFLHRTQIIESEQCRLRREAFSAVSNNSNATPLVSPVVEFLTEKTICASPTRSTVFLNTKARFIDGILDDAELTRQKQKVESLLQYAIGKLPHGQIFQSPENRKNEATPQFVITAPGVDLVDNLGTVNRDYELPISVHDSTGFLWTKGTQKQIVKPIDLSSIVLE